MSKAPEGWTPIERRLWQAVRNGVALDLAGGQDEGRAPPTVGSPKVEVSAGVLATLLLQPPAPAAGVVARLRLIGAHITGRLRLRHAEIRMPVELFDCRFDEPVELDHAAVRAADLTGCRLPALHADGLHTDGDLTLTRLTGGSVSLFKAQIGGNLWLNDARSSLPETPQWIALAGILAGWLLATTVIAGLTRRLTGSRANP